MGIVVLVCLFNLRVCASAYVFRCVCVCVVLCVCVCVCVSERVIEIYIERNRKKRGSSGVLLYLCVFVLVCV